MVLTLEGPLDSVDQLPKDLGPEDIGRTWWIGWTWYAWCGTHWFIGFASQERP